jgi:tRNA (guanine37-N1)-methyltransferase
MNFFFVSLHPKLVDSFSQEGLISRAIKDSKIFIRAIDLRKFGLGKHKKVDDRPYGGGAGMILRPEPIVEAIRSLGELPNCRRILLSARGKRFTQKKAEQLKSYENLVFVCGRYEGVDERVAKHYVDEEICIGPYVLMGGEVAAMAMTEAISRLVPGVLGNAASLSEESFNASVKREYPQYTRPEDFEGHRIPKVLKSGHHQKVSNWRKR